MTALVQTHNAYLETNLTSLGLDLIVAVLPNIEAEIDSTSSWRVYRQDIKSLAVWLYDHEINLTVITRVDLLNYRKYLQERSLANITINRMFTVARRVVAELVTCGAIAHSPLAGKSFKALRTNPETTHVALNDQQAADLLSLIKTATLKGKRDYAMVSLMLRCGLRREEVQQLNLGNIQTRMGHYVAEIEDGKGNQPATVKLPPDVWRYISEYWEALRESYPGQNAGLSAPLFVSMRKGDHLSCDATGGARRIDIKAIETLVKALGVEIEAHGLTPHGLRATFITLAMEHGATLEQTQYAARHKDPRTSERYRKRKMNLDNNAVDRLSFLARQE